jgi:hypothetical protein
MRRPSRISVAKSQIPKPVISARPTIRAFFDSSLPIAAARSAGRESVLSD